MNLPPDPGLWSYIGYCQVKVYRLRFFIVALFHCGALRWARPQQHCKKALELGASGPFQQSAKASIAGTWHARCSRRLARWLEHAVQHRTQRHGIDRLVQEMETAGS